jgi:hypothetical protein
MKKIITFSLFGDNYKYLGGILCNVELAKIIYPDWVCRIYHDDTVPSSILTEIDSNHNTELVRMEITTRCKSLMWRYLAIDDDDVEIMISRDADSRLSYREKKCVDIFMESDKILHSIRDNINHPNIMAGMWGIKKNKQINLAEKLKDYDIQSDDCDQKFLREEVASIFSNQYMIHCSAYLNNFPVKKENEYFVGMVFCGSNWGHKTSHIFY